jgi:hypothetical protein
MKQSELKQALGSLPRSIRPERDLWPGINRRLTAEAVESGPARGAFGWHKVAMAAAVLLALTTGIFIGRAMDVPSADPVAQNAMKYALIATVKATEREYQAAFSELISLDYSGLRLEGAEPDALRDTWGDLVQTETSLLAALQQYPTNTYLNEKLLDLRSQQLQFIKQLALLEQNDWRRT